jgi:hypothetical protein
MTPRLLLALAAVLVVPTLPLRQAHAQSTPPVHPAGTPLSRAQVERQYARAVYTANGLDRIFEDNRYTTAVVVGIANRIAESGLPTNRRERDRLADQLDQAAEAAQSCSRVAMPDGAPDVVQIAACATQVAESLPQRYRPAVAAEVGEFANVMGSIPRNLLVPGGDAGTRTLALQRYATRELDGAWTRARASGGQAAANFINRGLGEVLEAQTGLTPERILRNNPDLGRLVEESASLRHVLRTGTAPTEADVRNDLAAFVTSRLGTRESDLVRGGLRIAEAVEFGELSSAQLKDRVGTERAAVFLAAQTAMLIGGERGKQISNTVTTLGNATVAIRSLYANAGTLMAAGSTVGQLATLSTGVGAFVAVAGLFGGGGPFGGGGSQGDGAAIAALAAQIRAMHEEMRASFRRIDMKLDSLMSITVAGFEQMQTLINASTAANLARFDDVQRQLDVVQRQITELQVSLSEIRELVQEQPARAAWENCRDYRVRNPGGTIIPSTWINCLDQFNRAATLAVSISQVADPGVETGQFTREVLARLDRAVMPDSGLTYPFLIAAAQEFRPGVLRVSPLAIDRWALWSSNYAEILNDWSTLQRSDHDLLELRRHGAALQDGLWTLTGSRANPDTAFFHAVLLHYADRARALRTALDSAVLEYERDRSFGADLLLTERPAWLASDTTAPHLHIVAPGLNGGQRIPVPASALARFPEDVVDAARLGVQITLRGTYTQHTRTQDSGCLRWVDKWIPGPREADYKRRVCDHWLRHHYLRPTLEVAVDAPDFPDVARITFSLPELVVRTMNLTHRFNHSYQDRERYVSDALNMPESEWLALLLASAPSVLANNSYERWTDTVAGIRSMRRGFLTETMKAVSSSWFGPRPAAPIGAISARRAGQIWDRARDLRAAKLLVDAYLGLALPQSLRENRNGLRAMSFGEQGAYDDLSLASDTTTYLLDLWRTDAVLGRYFTWRDSIMATVRTRAGTEIHPLISGTTDIIDVTLRLQQLRRGEVPPPLTAGSRTEGGVALPGFQGRAGEDRGGMVSAAVEAPPEAMQLTVTTTPVEITGAGDPRPHRVLNLARMSEPDGAEYEVSFCARPSPDTPKNLPGHAFVAYSVRRPSGLRSYAAIGHTTHAPAALTLLTYNGILRTAVAGGLEEEKYSAARANCLVVKVNRPEYERALNLARDYYTGQLPSSSTSQVTALSYTLGAQDCMTFMIRVARIFTAQGLVLPERGAAELPLDYVRRMISSN